MARSSKLPSNPSPDRNVPARAGCASPARKANHLKDEVYREMLLLEMQRPGAEMGLALALLRAIVHSHSLSQQRGFKEWLKKICPVGLRMIEVTLGERSNCDCRQKLGPSPS